MQIHMLITLIDGNYFVLKLMVLLYVSQDLKVALVKNIQYSYLIQN